MLHTPTASNVTLPPFKAHMFGVVDVNSTEKPEVELAVKLNTPDVTVRAEIGLNVIFCVSLVTVKLRLTFCADAKVASPICELTMVQVPIVIKVTCCPATVQTAGVADANVTVKPEVVVAETLKAPLPSNRVAKMAKLIVCETLLTLKLRRTTVATA